jgi:hypothetical protein
MNIDGIPGGFLLGRRQGEDIMGTLVVNRQYLLYLIQISRSLYQKENMFWL